MIRQSTVRPAILSSTLLLALAFVACGSGHESARPANTNTTSNASTPASTPAAAVNATPEQSAAAGRAKLNLNTATGEEFKAAIPGLGDRMVHEFEEYRPYRSIQQFRREMGKYVKPEQIADYEKYVYVPINPNESDAATLRQIPGLDENEAQALIAARPFASNEAFLSKLAGSVSEAELAVARTYLGGR